jgi:hypothetical protein
LSVPVSVFVFEHVNVMVEIAIIFKMQACLKDRDSPLRSMNKSSIDPSIARRSKSTRSAGLRLGKPGSPEMMSTPFTLSLPLWV